MSEEKAEYPKIISGLYKHYKRGMFAVLGTSVNCKTNETVVVFNNIDDMSHFWHRPIEEFLSFVEVDGVQVPRFTRVENYPMRATSR